jgi:hypothetical protein
MKQTIRRIAVLLFSLVLALPMVYGQVTTSSMSGKITDENGAIAGATVIATYTPSGTQYYAISDKSGNFTLLNVRAGGPYTVKVNMLGYRDYEVTGINVALSDNYVLNVKMAEEAIGLDAIVVTADAISSNMRSDRAGAITTADTRTMQTLPTVSRSLNDVLSLTPQAAVTSNGLAVGGGTYRGSYVTVDGAAFNNAFGIGSNLPAGGTPISLDALDQLSISITPYDVRQSGFTGGSIQAVTKSGSNKFHASVYDYYTSQALQGKKYGKSDGTVGELTLSQMLKNTTGVTVGGPIIKDKLFFFFNFEYDMDVVPGQNRLARTSDTQEWGGDTQYNRPTVDQMNTMLEYLKTKYNYNPGRYQNYSASTPDYKLLARIDWNINNNNHFNIRYSQTKNKYSSAPSNSVNPIVPNPYTRNSYGRTSDCALYFESSRYFQEQNFYSIAAELNSRLMDGKLNNILRATYSRQYEPRSFVGDLFPTVDILENETVNGKENREVLTTFGPDPFTYGNLRDVNTVVATDELSGQFGIHNLIAGLSFEYDKAVNGFMQGGAGYYVYNSWNDFVNDELPVAFAITHGNTDDLSQTYPTFKTTQYAAYLQDEMSISERFKLTAGVRFELPVYPSMAFNENKEYTTLMASIDSSDPLYGSKTSDLPKARLNISPRIGFNWDITGDRSVVLRGGTGIFTGRLPMVWLVSAVGNSNVLQAQTIQASNTTVHFHTSVADILKELYGGSFKAKELPAPTATTIIDKNLRLPMTWKSSLALDVKLPWGVKGSLEGIFNKDLASVYVYKGGQKLSGNSIQLVSGNAATVIPTWTSMGIKNSSKSTVTPYLITNSPVNGWYYAVTAKLEKNFDHGFSAMVAYTKSANQVVNDAIGDQITSAYNTNTYNKFGSNVAELGYGTYVAPDRVVANVNYRLDYGNHFATTLGLSYEGYQYGYVGSYSYTRNSYLLYVQSGSYSNPITGDGGSATLLYVPTEAELNTMTFTSDENKAAFWKYVQGNKYLKSRVGQWTERGGEKMPWYNRFNFKFMQDFYIDVNGTRHDLQISADVNNVANLLNPKWGNIQRQNSNYILERSSKGVYTYQTGNGIWAPYASTISTWSALLSVRYSF